MEYETQCIIEELESHREKTTDVKKKEVIESFIAGIKKYGYSKPLIAPRKATWDVTARCNLRCQHCSNKELSYGEDLTTEQVFSMLNNLKDFGIQHLSFSGGEPLLRSDIFDILKETKELGIAATLATNSTLVDADTARTLSQIGVDSIQTSIDGIGKTHDTFRGVVNSFDKARKGIENLVQSELTVVVTTTVSSLNCSEIEKIIDLCLEMGVHAYVINDLIPVGWGRDLLEKRLTNEQYSAYSTFFAEKRSALKGKLELLWGGVGTFGNKKRDAERLIIQTRCLACFHRFNIAADGTVQPCNLLPLNAGNIVNEGIEDIWTNSPVFTALRDRDSLKGKCGRCDFRYSCGGCRARAYAVHHDFLAEDPRCQRCES
ncbi:MAG: radical SAM protein [Theionarchaea archaeon]|nr:radical SAM protein [Theionarchaea archaeon]